MISPAMDTIVASGAAMLLIGLLFIMMRSRKMGTRTPFTFYAYPNAVAGRAAARSYPGFALQQPSTSNRASTPVKRNSSTKKVSVEAAKIGTWENSSARLINPLDFPAIPVARKPSTESASPVATMVQTIVLEEPPVSEASSQVPQTAAEMVTTTLAPVTAPPEFVVEPLPLAIDENPMNFNATHGSKDRTPEPKQDTEIVRGVDPSAATDLLGFHGLKQQPFDVTPDPAFLYFSPSHHDALTSLTQGIENFRGFMALVAEPGMGKTTLLNKLMDELGDTARVVFLFQTQCTSSQLIGFILDELQIDHSAMDIVAMHRALNNALMGEMLLGRRFVLVVDEAQNLQDSVLETIRLLSDFETTHSKLIQIVLSGQPQLAETLMRPNLAQLRQRIATVSSLEPLGAGETAEYVEHRLRAAGWIGKPIFTPEALEAIAVASKGVPRSINNICFNALHLAFSQGQDTIDSTTVRKVASQLDLASLVRRSHRETTTIQPAAHLDRSSTVLLARALIAALSGEAKQATAPAASTVAEAPIKPKAKSGVFVNGTVTDMVRSQSWGKRDEYRIQISLERDPNAGVALADRYYCCNLYLDDEQAAALRSGKPVRIRIEQD